MRLEPAAPIALLALAAAAAGHGCAEAVERDPTAPAAGARRIAAAAAPVSPAPDPLAGLFAGRRVYAAPSSRDWNALGLVSRDLRQYGRQLGGSVNGAAAFSMREGATLDTEAVVAAFTRAGMTPVELIEPRPGEYVVHCGHG